MGKKADGKKTTEDGEAKNSADGVENKGEETFSIVLKLDLHCEGCAKKVQRAVTQFEGVEKVKAECSVNKLTVIGNVDPTRLRDKVEQKTKKKVDLIAPPPSKKPQEKKVDLIAPTRSKKPQEKDADAKPKEVAISTVVMKIRLHCDECAHKIKRIILKNIVGVNSVTTDLEKGLVAVTGTINAAELAAYLEEKLKRSVVIIPPLKIDKRELEKQVEDDQSKASKVEVINKMEYRSFNPHTHYAVPPMYYNQSYANQVYGNYGGPPPPPPEYVNIDDTMFSDENPNGCSVM